jgi:plastocyanin
MKSLWQVVLRPILGISFLALGASLLGCNEQGVTVVTTTIPSPSPTPEDMGVASGADLASAAAQMATVTVGPNNTMTFSPQTVTISAGGAVHWVWSSTSIPHTVTSGANGVADGKFCDIPAGQQVSAARCAMVDYAHVAPFSFDQRFDTAGNFPYYCSVHGAIMSGMVIVQ